MTKKKLKIGDEIPLTIEEQILEQTANILQAMANQFYQIAISYHKDTLTKADILHTKIRNRIKDQLPAHCCYIITTDKIKILPENKEIIEDNLKIREHLLEIERLKLKLSKYKDK